MSKPKVADRKPIKVELKKGEEQYWCARGHNHLNQFNKNDIATWKKDMADLTGIKFGGVG